MGRVLAWLLFCVAAAAVTAWLGSTILAFALLGIAAGLVLHHAWSARRRPEPALSMRDTLERKLREGSLSL